MKQVLDYERLESVSYSPGPGYVAVLVANTASLAGSAFLAKTGLFTDPLGLLILIPVVAAQFLVCTVPATIYLMKFARIAPPRLMILLLVLVALSFSVSVALVIGCCLSPTKGSII